MITETSFSETRSRIPGQTRRISTTRGTAFITLTRDLDGQPYEAFLNIGKAGFETFALTEALGWLISLALRIQAPFPQSGRVRDTAYRFEHISSMANSASLPSIPDALAKALREFLAEEALQDLPCSLFSEIASDERPHLLLPKVVSDGRRQQLSTNVVLSAAGPRRKLLVMNLSNLLQTGRSKKTTYGYPIFFTG